MGCSISTHRAVEVEQLAPKLESEDTGIPSSTESEIKLKPSMYIGNNKLEFNKFYTPAKKLGSGGYADVYLCRMNDSNNEYAVKVINKQKVSSKRFKNDLLKEVEYLKELDHPNIAKLHDVYQDSLAFYIVMDPCYGGELFDEIIRRQRITEHESAALIKQILSGVCYLHKNNIVHRDLKPENLLLESPRSLSRIKIVDFGLSTHFKGDVLTDRLGTVYYIAPEVLNRNYDEKCDVWSCGVILYILLCGYPPFSAHNDKDIIKKVSSGKYCFPDEEWSDVSDEAKDLINLMLTYDPKKRISAMDALQHPWIVKFSKMSKDKSKPRTMNLALNNLKTFTKTQKLAQAVMLLIANRFTTNDEINELSKLFSDLDTNGDGCLDRKELIQGYKNLVQNLRNECSKMSSDEIEKEVDEIIRTCDLDHSGFIDYSEFITGCIDKHALFSKERLKLAFSTFDVDGSGKISHSEISQIFGITNIPQLWSEIFDQIDSDKDGEIDFDEFVKMLDILTIN